MISRNTYSTKEFDIRRYRSRMQLARTYHADVGTGMAGCGQGARALWERKRNSCEQEVMIVMWVSPIERSCTRKFSSGQIGQVVSS